MEVIVGVLIASFIGPVTLLVLTNRYRREDWARQDRVADRAAETAELLLANNQAVADTAEVTNNKLDVIHTLVNSNMTAALQGELDSTRANLATLRELIALRVSQGQEPNNDTLAALATLEAKVKKLAANLSDRLEQTKVADAQIFIAKESKSKKKDGKD